MRALRALSQRAEKKPGTGTQKKRQEIAVNYKAEYEKWRVAVKDGELLTELQTMTEDQLEDAFYRDLSFGTGGLRGVLGAGTNRMNTVTVARASQGLADYLHTQAELPSVAIAYDSRIHSDLFAETAACVFAANDVQAYLYPRLMPTPSLSFAVRDLGCTGGVVITASHNPAKYNGYKVYGSDGCQITTEAAAAIQAAIDAVNPFLDVKKADFETALADGRIRWISEGTVDRYLAAVASASVLPEEVSRDISIVYTPLNGAGISCVPRCLAEHGFSNITLVEEQKTPDGNFPTCPYPNPEIREALTCGLRWAEKTGSDLLLATDPDCDRVGVAVKGSDGYVLISGNEMGVLLLDFICRMRLAAGTMPARPVAVKTIVTTPMAAKIAAHYGVELRDVLTGFKFIGEQIGLLEKAGEAQRYVFGFEESYGYLSGSFVRDKDAVNASLLICEMFAWYRAQGKSLLDMLDELYCRYGFYGTRLLTFGFEGSSGLAEMQRLMSAFREQPPHALAGLRVESVKDYLPGLDGLPKSDVLRFFLENGMEAVMRPSGTEPKLKIYLTTVGEDRAACTELADRLEQAFRRIITTHTMP